MKRSHRVLFAVGITAVVLLLASVALLETAFFHINPLKPGFHRFDFGRYVVLVTSPVPQQDYETIAGSMSHNEATVGLHYKSKVQIIICDKQSDIDRFQPFASVADRRNATAFAPWPNTVYVTPKARENYGTIERTVAHELSHVLLIQNYGVFRMSILWRQAEWIPEGFATYLNGWPDYFPRTQLLERIKKAGIDDNTDRFPSTDQLRKLPLPLRYMIYRYFVEYLYQTMPSTTVVQFLKNACDKPGEVPVFFQTWFGSSLDSYWNAFRMSLVRN